MDSRSSASLRRPSSSVLASLFARASANASASFAALKAYTIFEVSSSCCTTGKLVSECSSAVPVSLDVAESETESSEAGLVDLVSNSSRFPKDSSVEVSFFSDLEESVSSSCSDFDSSAESCFVMSLLASSADIAGSSFAFSFLASSADVTGSAEFSRFTSAFLATPLSSLADVVISSVCCAASLFSLGASDFSISELAESSTTFSTVAGRTFEDSVLSIDSVSSPPFCPIKDITGSNSAFLSVDDDHNPDADNW
nr:hypothetical protein Iba_chr03aCG20600 [Ipomoea batatas]